MVTEEESPPDASTEEDLKATITIREVPPAPDGRISDVTMSSSSCSDVNGKDSRAMEGIDADVMVPDLEAEESNGADSADPVDKETSEEGSVPVAMKTMSHDSVKIPGADQPGAQEVPAEVVEDSNESFLSSANDTDNADTESDSKQNKLNVEAKDTINAEGGSNDIGKKIIEATTATGDDDISKASANSPRSSKEYEPSMLPNVESNSLTKNEMNDISELTAPDKSELPTIAIPSKSDAEEDLSKRPIKSTDTKTPPPPPPPPPPPLVKEGEKSKRPKGRRSSNARNEDDIPRPTSRQTRRDDAHSHHSHGHSRHSKHKHPSSSSRRTPPRSKPDVDNPTGSSSSPSSSSSSSSSANRHRVPSVKETKPYPSPPSVGSSATTSSRKSSSPSPSRTPKPSSESPTSSLVGEAERQAAIAAAIAANASSMSPSVAAGIAKVLALPSLMGGRVGGVGGIGGGGGGMIGGMGGFGSSHSLLGSSLGNGGNARRSLSPHSSQQQQQQRQQQLQQQQQVRHDSQHPHNLQPHHHHYHHHHHKSHPRQSHPAPPPPRPPGNVAPHQMGPTMVALPPQPPVPPPPQPLPPRMKPVRFEDVRVAFDELLWLKENGGDGQNEGEEMDGHGEKKKEIEMDEDNEKNKNDQKGNVGVKDEVPTDADEKNVIEKDNQIEFEATKGEDQTHSNDGVKVDLERGEGEDGEDGKDGAASSPNSVKDAVKTEHEVEKESIEDVMKGEDTETKEQQSKEVETKSNSLSCIDKESGEDTKENAADSAPSSDIAKTGVHSSPETMTDGKNESKNDFDKSMNEGGNSCDAEIRETNGEHAGEAFEDTKKSKSDAADAEPKVPRTTIPDAFLRFLLLVARVPIILEGNEKLPITPRAGDKKAFYKSKNRKVTDAAKIASKRALEVLILAQNAFDTVSEKQKQLLQDQAKFDATLSFFAACAGELDSGMKTSESKEKSAEKNAKNERPPQKQRRRASLTSSTNAAAAAVVSASTVFSNVMSKVTKKQGAFSDLGKKWMAGAGASTRVDQTSESKEVQNFSRSSDNDDSSTATTMEDYEIVIDQEMLGLTVENVLERTIIRTLLPDGAAKRTGAKIGSLIAKVGNVDTSNLTHFETIDELRQSQRPLKLTLRHISSDVLRCAREEMGRLIRGRGWASSEEIEENSSRPWKGSLSSNKTKGETFDSLLRERWPSKSNSNVASSNQNGTPPIFTRAEMMHQNGKDLIRILSLLVVGMEKELSDLQHNSFHQEEESTAKRLTSKELTEAIEITSKILLDYARGHPDVVRKPLDNANDGNKGSSFFPTPPGRVQGKKHGAPGGNTKPAKGKKGLHESPLLRIGDALQRTRSFLVESSSITAATLRWEIIDYLCIVLDLDTEQELSENEAASSTEGGEASPINDLGSAGSILKLIVLNCTTAEDSITGSGETSDTDSISTANQIARNKRNAGNCFLSVVHRLAASKSVSARVSACSLGPVLWNHLDFPRQLQLRGVITRALHDVDVGVRKATAAVVHEISEMLFDRRAVPWTVLMVERSMTDPEPQLRAAAMTLTWHLAEHLPNAFLGDASKGSLSIRRLPPRTDPTFMDVYLLQCKLLPVASNLAEDRIASVRLSVAAQCDRLCSALGEHWFSVIIDLLQALLSDRDDRVRSEAILCMPRLVESVILGASEDRSVSVLESLLPQALKMQKDASVVVRSSLATATGELLVFLVGLGGAGGSLSPPPSPGQGGVHIDEVGSFKYYKKHVDQTLIPLLQKLLQDTNPDVTSASLRAVTNASRSGARDRSSIPSCAHKPEVDDDLVSLASHQSHSSIDRTKPVFIPVLSEEQVLRLLPTLSNLATSSQWRVRQSAVEIVPALLGCTYRLETRNEISKLCIRLMSDKVDTVRKTAAECFCLGGSSLARHGEDDGGEWITKIVVPHLRTCSQSEDSKQRLLSLKMIEIIITNGLCPAKGSDPASSPGSFDDSFSSTDESPMRMLLEIASSRASDNVANVRLNVGRVLGSVFFLLDRSDVDYVVSVLERQLEDETSKANGGDRDVVYFAQQALASRSLRRLESR